MNVSPPCPADRVVALWEESAAPPELEAIVEIVDGASLDERLDGLLEDLYRRWPGAGRRPLDDYFRLCPDIRADSSSAIDLIYAEYQVRCRLGEIPDPVDYLDKYVDLRQGLAHQFEVHCYVEAAPPGKSWFPASTPDNDQEEPRPANPDTSPDLRAPLRAEDYEIIKTLGSGGMGTVLSVFQKSTRRYRAMKILHREQLGSAAAVERFLREAQFMAGLRHPGIVRLHGIGKLDDGRYFLILDLIEGSSLQRLMEKAPLPVGRVASLVAQVARAIAHAHESGVIHRDLKPANILIDAKGTVLVTDFGLASGFGDEESHGIAGTPEFMAPEQVDPKRWGSPTLRTDIYGIGALLYALSTGRPPFPGTDLASLFQRVASDEKPLSPRKIHPEIPQAIEEICERAMEKDPYRRYDRASEVAEALSPWLDEAPPRSTRHLAPWFAVAAILLGVALILWRTWSRPSMVEGPVSGTLKVESFEVVRVRDGEIARLPGAGGVLTNGDKVRIEGRLSRPSNLYVFWLGSEGSGSLIYPEPGQTRTSSATDAIRWPAEEGVGCEVVGPDGTELIVLIATDEPLSRAELAGIDASIARSKALPHLGGATILVDEVPALTSMASRDRGVGQVKPLGSNEVTDAIVRVRKFLPARIKLVKTLAIAHRSTSGD